MTVSVISTLAVGWYGDQRWWTDLQFVLEQQLQHARVWGDADSGGVLAAHGDLEQPEGQQRRSHLRVRLLQQAAGGQPLLPMPLPPRVFGLLALSSVRPCSELSSSMFVRPGVRRMLHTPLQDPIETGSHEEVRSQAFRSLRCMQQIGSASTAPMRHTAHADQSMRNGAHGSGWR